MRETYKNDSQGYFSNVTLYFTGKCSVKYPPGRVEYAETTKFILSQEKALCEFVSKLFEKLSIYISFFIIFFNIFQVTFIKLHSQTHKIEKTG